MALVVFLRGVNVGGHKIFRPSVLAKKMRRLDVVNIGAAGTFVVREPIGPSQLRAKLAGHLPFKTEIVVCKGKEILSLISENKFIQPLPVSGTVQFVSVLSRLPRRQHTLPIQFPSNGRWLLKIVGRKGRFVFGQYRRNMKAIGYLGQLDQLYEVPLTTRNWNTFNTIATVLRASPGRKSVTQQPVNRTEKKKST